jgi:hypothetical protein
MHQHKPISNVLIALLALINTLALSAQIQAEVLDTLPSIIWETSGLVPLGDQWITHNDSGDAPQLYVIDKTSADNLRVVSIENANHIDWEDVAVDDTYLYIGDFGNNLGDRQDLRIYRVLLSDLGGASANAEVIEFTFEDQTDFTSNSDTNFDAEALVTLGDSLYVFTKERGQMGTTAYRLPKEPGTYAASNQGSYAVNGLVTAAQYDAVTDRLWLCGYSSILIPFVALVEEVSQGSVLSGPKQKFSINTGIAQIEALSIDAEGMIYLSSEQFNRTNPPIESLSRLFRFSTDFLTEEEEEEEEEEEMPEEPLLEEGDLVLFRPQGESLLYYRLETSRPVIGRALYDTTGRQVEFTPLERLQEGPIDLSALPPAVYYLSFILTDGQLTKAFLRPGRF